jgi:D-beta-D-heptose 7-phosphate kinase/D-beta-D-heptose 1-phosphate adenosyltransferase
MFYKVKFMEDMLKAIEAFPRRRILVVGDIMMDQFIWGEVSRISPEAPVPVVQVKDETFLLGGAANVVNNLLGLGGRVYLAGVIGNDGTGRRLLKKLQVEGVNTDGVVIDEGRPTAVKTRVIAHHQQVVRVDKEENGPLGSETLDRLVRGIRKNAPQFHGIIVSDYDKGVISRKLMGQLKKIAAGAAIPILVDPKPRNMEWYRGVTLITPNHLEAAQAVGRKIESEADLRWAGQRLLRDLNCASVLITRGPEGMSLFTRDKKISHIPTVAKKVFDVTGAGDTVIATLALALVAGLALVQACRAANYAAGIVVGEVGTAAIQSAALKKVLQEAPR